MGPKNIQDRSGHEQKKGPPQLTSPFVVSTLGLSPVTQKSNFVFSQITTDSRQIKPGSLFVAIKGDKFDGHDFILATLQAGARGIICNHTFDQKQIPESALIFSVPDTLEAYRKLASAWRQCFSIPVVAVAGSVGKTTTKELLHAILQGKWKNVLKTHQSQNGFIGIPMTLFDLTPEHEAAVIEVGIDEIGAMKKHIEIVQANTAVLTTIGPEHLEKLIDVPTVAREEAIALEYVAKQNGTVVINLDDPWIEPLDLRIHSQKKLAFSLCHSESKTSMGTPIVRGKVLGDILQIQAQFSFDVNLPLPGEHNAKNLLAAISVALALGLTPIEIRTGLLNFKTAMGRSEFKTLKNNVTVLCDYYNANPSSMNAALDLLIDISTKKSAKRKIACLGDMLELGSFEEQMHRDLAIKIIESKLDHVFLYGPRMKWLLDELKQRGFSGKKVAHFDDHDSLARSLSGLVNTQDCVLLKGSRGMRMEKVFDALEQLLK